MVVCSKQPVDIAFFCVESVWRKESTVVRPDPQLKDRLLQFIRNNHTEMYRQWFTDLEPLGVEGGVLTILVKQDVHRRYLENKAVDTFQEAAQAVTGRLLGLKFVEEGELESPLLPATSMGQEVVVLSPDLTFDQFVVGSNNQLANAASIAVCDRPGRSYNPLFLYANVGLGKTHLLQSIGHRLNTTSSQTRWMLTTCEEFSSNFQEALIHQTVSEFRARYRDLDVLLVDDIQELAGREKIQEEFFHTFNALHQAGKQIVLTANAAPSDIPQLEERLISRFASGLVTRIEPPEFETRVAIVHQKAKLHGFQLSENVAAFLAARVDGNIRELEGALTRIHSLHVLQQLPITLDLAKIAIGIDDGDAPRSSTPSIQDIMDAIGHYYDLKLTDLLSRRRHKSVAMPRQLGMWLARRYTRYSLEEIGSYFGGRDHTTVMHAVKAVTKRREEDETVASEVQIIEQMLLGEQEPEHIA